MTPRKADGLPRWLSGAAEPPPVTRLSPATAVELAAASPGVRALGRPLRFATTRAIEGRVLWRVSSGGVGAQWWVEVDDETEGVGEVHHAATR